MALKSGKMAAPPYAAWRDTAVMKINYVPKTKPYSHQKAALRKGIAAHGKVAYFMEMRTGKSKVSLDLAGILAQFGRVHRVLIFCPFSSMGVWRREIQLHVPDTLRDYIEWRIVNYENAYSRAMFQTEDGSHSWVPVDNDNLMEFQPDLLIVDESHIIANTSSVTHRKIYKIAKHTPYIALLTGTPGTPDKIFGQFRILDESVFGNSMRDFQTRFCRMGGYMSKQIKGYKNEDEFRALIAPYVYQCTEADAWEVPQQRNEIVPVTLVESYPTYTQMMRDAVVRINEHTEVTAPAVVTQVLRLMQITSGHLPVRPGQKPRRTGREKEKVYRGLVHQLLEAGHEKLVTFCRFLPDIAACARACQAEGVDIFLLHGKVPADIRHQRIADFDEWANPAMFISQTRTGSMSVDLASATDAIYYSLDYSLTAYEQSRARIRGHRQKGKRLTYWHLLAENTVDEVAYLALQRKQELIRLILRHPELLRRTT